MKRSASDTDVSGLEVIGTEDDANRTLVVMESGSVWPSWLNSPQGEHGGSTVHAQMQEESPGEFARRVIRRIRDGSGSSRVVLAVLVWGDDMSAPALGARFRVARTIAGSVAKEPAAEVVISAAFGADDARRHELMALAGALCVSLSDSDVALRVRFTKNPAKSATRLRVPEGIDDSLDHVG